jgi:hypothetical protein
MFDDCALRADKIKVEFLEIYIRNHHGAATEMKTSISFFTLSRFLKRFSAISVLIGLLALITDRIEPSILLRKTRYNDIDTHRLLSHSLANNK